MRRIFSYLHLSNQGLTEGELIDILSLDDEVLIEVFDFSEPPIRRFPVVLWARIHYLLDSYLVTREAFGGDVSLCDVSVWSPLAVLNDSALTGG